MASLTGRGKKKKVEEALKLIRRRARDSSIPGNAFLRNASYVVPEDAKTKRDEAFLYVSKKEVYKYITLEQLPCGDVFRNKHHMQYDPIADWRVPMNDVYYISQKNNEPEKKTAPVPLKPTLMPPKLKEVLQMRPRRMTDRRKSMNPRGIYERPPMNPNPKGMYNGFGRKSTFVPPPKQTPPVQSSTCPEDVENEDKRAPMAVRIKDSFIGHSPTKQRVFMALKLEVFRNPSRQSFIETPIPPLTPPESSSSSEPETKPQKLVKRRVKDKLYSHNGSASSRGSIFIKWESTMEDDYHPQSREPLFKCGGVSDGSDTPKERVKANYEKYAICYKKHHVVADVCLACEKDETYGLFTETLKTEPWKLPRRRPNPRDMKVACSPADKKKRKGVPHSQFSVMRLHTYHAKKAARIADEKAEMRKHLSDTLRKFHCHLYKFL